MVPATQSLVETIMASPIQAIILRPFTRISSARPLHQIELTSFNNALMNAASSACPHDPANRPRFVHPAHRHEQSPGSDSHTKVASLRSRSTPVAFAARANIVPCLAADGVFADLASIALPFAIMDGNVALSYLAGCRDTSGSGKMTLTCPSAFVCRFA